LNTRISFTNARLRIGLIVASFATLAVPTAALAQSPADRQYDTTLEFISQGGGGDPGATATTSPGDLPFTGLDVALLAAVAVGLLLAGLMLRRARPNES
jgi:hypothetical protein